MSHNWSVLGLFYFFRKCTWDKCTHRTKPNSELSAYLALGLLCPLPVTIVSGTSHWGSQNEPQNHAEPCDSLQRRCRVSHTTIHAVARNTSGWEKHHLRCVYTAPPAHSSNSRFTQQFDGCGVKKKDFCSSYCGCFLTETITVLMSDILT